jgi:hypothetical protein
LVPTPHTTVEFARVPSSQEDSGESHYYGRQKFICRSPKRSFGRTKVMKPLLIICLSVLVLGALPASAGERGPATLAQDYSVVARSEDPKHVFLGTPAIARLPNGRYVVTYDRFRNDCEGCIVVTSDDRGRTWTEQARVALQWASPFVIEQSLFLIGNNQKRDARDIAIARSDDGGQTWTPVRVLFQ